MNTVTRVTNQAAIDYYQISGSRRVDDPTRSPRRKIKNDQNLAIAGLFRGFYSTTKLPGGKSSTGKARFSDGIPDVIAVNPPRSPAKKCMNELRIRFDEYRINRKAEMFKFCLVGKFPTAVAGATLEQVKEMASSEWNLQGSCSITLLDQSHLFIRLENEVDMIRVWPRNQWSVNGELMKIFKWAPLFRPSDGELPSAAVWMTLPSLPVVFYQEDLLCQIASLVGKVLGVDDATRNLTRTDSARVCVEIDLLKEFPSKVWIEVGAKGFWQAIEYEEKPCFCSICSAVGHKASSCIKKIDKAGIDASKKDTSRFEIKNCDARGEYFHTTPLFGDIKHAHSFRGGSDEIMGEERNGDIIGSSSVQDKEKVNSDTDIEVSKKNNQPGTEPVVMTIIEELFDAEEPVTIGISGEQGEVEMGNTESVSKTQNQENGDHGASSSKAKQSYSRRSNHTARKQNLWRRDHSPEKPLAPGYSTRRFSLAEMTAASKCFKELIGEGGFGQVYKGKLGNDVVAIKRWSSNSHQGLKQFEAELLCGGLGYCWHMVALVGYCNENDELLLVYEYMSNGDLSKHLFHKTNTARLSWAQRLVICIGAARALHHLHSNGVIHRDIKTSNILMDHNWEAKLTDFGISKLAKVNEQSSTHVSTFVMGTYGYADPCYMATGHLTYQSDVYSFGVVMLEILFGRPVIDSGRRNLDVWRKSCQKKKIPQSDIAADLKGKIPPECLKEYSALALKCLADQKSDRPAMKDVIDKLQFLLQLTQDYEHQRR